MARAVRWVIALALVDMRWISDVGVRWGRVGVGRSVEAWVDGSGGEFADWVVVEDSGGGCLGGVVVIVRMVVVVGGWWMGDRGWNGIGRAAVVDLRVGDFGIVLWV